MNKILKIRNNFFDILTPEMLPLLFIDERLFDNGWIYNNYLNLDLTKKNRITFFENEYFKVDHFTNVFFENFFFYDKQIFIFADYDFSISSTDIFDNSLNSLQEMIIKFIDNCYYLLGTLNDKIIKKEFEYKKFLIYGYDESQRVFHIIAYVDNKYKSMTLDFDFLLESLAEQENETKKGTCLISCFKTNLLFHEAIDISQIKLGLSQYVVTEIDRPSENNALCLFDIQRYMIDNISNDTIDENFFLSIKTLYAHLCFMKERIIYLIKKDMVLNLERDYMKEIKELSSRFAKIMSHLEVSQIHTPNEKIKLCQEVDDFINGEKILILDLIESLR